MIDYIYENKTSALIEASVMTGAILGGATEEEIAIHALGFRTWVIVTVTFEEVYNAPYTDTCTDQADN